MVLLRTGRSGYPGKRDLSSVSKASEIGRDWHLNLTIGSQIDTDVMQPMMEKILAGDDVAESVKAASDVLDSVIAGQ